MFAGKIGEKLGIPDLAEKLGSLSGSELNTLLLEVMGQKAGELTPAKMRDAYAKSRFLLRLMWNRRLIIVWKRFCWRRRRGWE